MRGLNPIEKAKYIEKSFREYINSSFAMDDEIYNEQFEIELSETDILKGPYISKNLEFKNNVSLNDLINKGIVHPEFRNLNNVYIDRKLRLHQEKAIDRIKNGHNLIITTGTGSGKTESFLYPILNEILKDENINEAGVRAIFLFPMNALVNDQFDRVRKILSNYPKIKYSFFTGNTPDKVSKSLKDEYPANELIDREQIRNFPPHILFTNYSMLEYILLRPKDNTLLNPNNLDKWKFIVMDEAHVYKGALGIEVGMLMRRLKARIGHDVQFILSSATLGDQSDESIRQIQEFGYNLTSGIFEKEDILFSERISLLKENIKYKIEPKDYKDLYNDLTIDKIDELLNKYNNLSTESTIDGKLYDLLVGDENLYILDDYLENARDFSEFVTYLEQYGFNDYLEVLAFIELISKSKKNGLKIMDLKYHCFVKGVSGAYVTLGDNPKLSLSPREFINGKRAFEIGTCKKCNSVYIIGTIKDHKLYQNDSVDIYENYDSEEELNVDYFVLSIEKPEDKVEEYELCPICGKIIGEKETNKQLHQCEHRNVNKIKVYKIIDEDNKQKNNICTCVICAGHDRNGIVRTINMGKESATALITQIYFETLDRNDEEEIIIVKPQKPTFFKKSIQKTKKKYAKQILAFSDARQQASYAAAFAEKMHHRLLRKRLIVEILKNRNYKALDYDEALGAIEQLIKQDDLFDGQETPTIQAKVTLLEELLVKDGIYSGEGLGLYYFEYKIINELIDELDQETIDELLDEYNVKVKITKKEFKYILEEIIDFFRPIPAVHYEGLDADLKEKYLGYRKFDNYVQLVKSKSLSPKKKNNVRGLLSSTNRLNKIEKHLCTCLNIDKSVVEKFISDIWEIFVNNNLLKLEDSVDMLYTVNASEFRLCYYKDAQWYYCNKCRKITRFNINDVCPHCASESTLSLCDPDIILSKNYYRNKYINKKIEKLSYYEHTAQLSPEKAKERQIQFANKEINFLSCSTTFEMGIDIGSLENVLMRNVPPSPANYVQRAGRAGRGEDSSAFVLTYCSNMSHDYTFFENPLRMVEGVCNAPIFELSNQKIIYRHLLATAFSCFFRYYNDYFESVKSFYFDGGFLKFKEFLLEKNTEVIHETDQILKSTVLVELMNGKWIDKVVNEDFFEFSYKKINELVKELENGKEEAKNRDDDKALGYYNRQLDKIYKSKDIIEKLADGNLIPKYGFPTDLVELNLKDTSSIQHNYDLTRSMQIALSEYAPDSEVMVDKNIIRSKYINKVSDLLEQIHCECKECHKTMIFYDNSEKKVCKFCNEEIKDENRIPFVTPKYGFTGEVYRKESQILKPKKSFTSPIKYIGNGTSIGEKINFFDVVECIAVKDDELLIINENAFFTCEKCGYSKIDNEKEHLPYIIDDEKHTPIFGKCDNLKLVHKKLGYLYKSDVLKLEFKIPFNGNKQTLSVLYALLEGISLAFDIERNDIDGICVSENGRNVFVLFDTVPGGAGYVKRLLSKENLYKSFEMALSKVSQNCCDTACYNCIKNYKNQRLHKQLDRELAKQALDILLSKMK